MKNSLSSLLMIDPIRSGSDGGLMVGGSLRCGPPGGNGLCAE
jgi:hypothetical protein